MSKSRKHVKLSILQENPEPEGNQKIAKVLNTLGSNQIEVQLPSGEKMLVLLPQKFSKLVWTKKNDFVIISTDKQIGPDHRWKVKGIIDQILLPDHVRHLKKIGKMPEEFLNEEEEEAKETVDWEEGNPNRREDSEDEDEDSEDDSDDERPRNKGKLKAKPIIKTRTVARKPQKVEEKEEEEEKDEDMEKSASSSNADVEMKSGKAEEEDDEEWEDVDEDDEDEEEEGEGDEEEWVTDDDDEDGELKKEEATKRIKQIPKQKWSDGMYEFEEISEDEIPEDAIVEDYD